MVPIAVNGKTYLVSERIGRLIRWLVERAEEISALKQVRVTFNCNGNTIHSGLHIYGQI